MNKTTESFLRNEIKEGLKMLKPENHEMFKRMYAGRTEEDKADMEMPIDLVVDNMPVEKLDHALSQIERTIKNLKEVKE